MYIRVLQDDLEFPDDRDIDQDTKSLIRGVSFFFPPNFLKFVLLITLSLSATAERSFTSYM